VSINVSDIKLGLTQRQYCDLFALSQAVSRVVAPPPESVPAVGKPNLESTESSSKKGALNSSNTVADFEPANLEPEIALSPRRSIYPTLDLELKIMTVKLQLFDDKALSEEDLRNCGIARFALHDNSVRFKMFSNGGGEAEVVLKSFTVNNTMPGPSKFREIIPAAKHDRNQFMVLFTMTGGKDNNSLAIITVESPKFLFTLEPLFALGNFFASAFVTPSSEEPADTSKPETTVKTKSESEPVASQPENPLAFRVDLNDVSVTLLESDTDANSQAIQLSIQQVMMSQQVRSLQESRE
jgi:vacuolar protein sorting-associated protein 13A/C